jgi:Zn-dependent peptidase ImmA (M78 family)/transcriptional regulator with XRE-family HTH domain
MMLNLGVAIREARSALGLDLPTVAEAAKLDPPSLLRYESGELEIPGEVVWRLSDVLGIPFEDLDSSQALNRHLGALALRFKADRRAIPERSRLTVARAFAAARAYVELEQIAGTPSRHDRLVSFSPKQWPLPSTRVWRAGRDLAQFIREHLTGEIPVRSMIELVERLGILVLWQKLPDYIAGYAFCDELHGPTIVLNVNGRNVNELVRRFCLAHELCHLLIDRGDFQRMSSFDTYDDFYTYTDDIKDPRESRANAFAIHLLAPEQEFISAWRERSDIRHLMTTFGASFEAIRHHLDNYELFPLTERVSRVATTAPDEWKNAESMELWYPGFDDIPIERRHSIAKLAFRLWKEERITTRRLREELGVTFNDERLRELLALYDASVAAA